MSIEQVSQADRCLLCGRETRARSAYERSFRECPACGFIFAVRRQTRQTSEEKKEKPAAAAIGKPGPAWPGPGGGGGYREYFLIELLRRDLGMRSFLIYGPGDSPTFKTLREQGFDVCGCDLRGDLNAYYSELFGREVFFRPDDLPTNRFDAVIAVEVFEHFDDPPRFFGLLAAALKDGGIICGTTDFYPGGPLENEQEPGYMKPRGHVAYWSKKSLAFLAATKGMTLAEFELIRPGSVLPDEKFGILWPNKRVFFLYHPGFHGEYFEALKTKSPILPIDKP